MLTTSLALHPQTNHLNNIKMALAAYRHLLRSSRIAFQGISRFLQSNFTSCIPPFSLSPPQSHTNPAKGDIPTLTAARQEITTRFRANRALPSSSPEATQEIAHAEEVAKILLQNIVQGKRANEVENKDWEGDLYSEFFGFL